MRVLVVHTFYRLLGGEDRYVQEQVELLGDTHDVRLFAARNDELESSAAAVRAMLTGHPRRSALREAIDDFRPDVVHVHNSYPSLGPAAFKEAGRASIPLVMTLHNYRLRCPNGYFFTHDGICRRCERGNYLQAVRHNCLSSRAQSASYALTLWVHRFVSRVESSVARFVAPSRFLATALTDAGLPESKLTVVPNFAARNVSPERERTYGLYVGRLSREKGVMDLVHALADAGELPFRVIGTGPAEAELRQAARSLPYVEFAGQQTPAEVQAALRGAAFLVIPSVWYENAPLVALEALAAGCPLLVSDLGGLPELVATGAGRTFRPNDPAGLAASLRRIAADHDGRRAMGEEARRLHAERYSPEPHRSMLEDVYEQAVAGG